MKRITLTIDIETDGSRLAWILEDCRGMSSTGISTDSGGNLAALWSGDIEHLLKDAFYRGGGELET